jgi:hypothetical protein
MAYTNEWRPTRGSTKPHPIQRPDTWRGSKKKIKEETDTVIYMYADDMALVSDTIPDLQRAVGLLSI